MATTNRIDLRPHALPYYDPVTERSGWQFALPLRQPAERKGNLIEALRRKLSTRVVVVLGDGTSAEYGTPVFTPPSAPTPGKPLWGWVPVDVGGSTEFARVVAPTQGPGKLPLDGPFYTRYGASFRGGEPSLEDLPFDIEVAPEHLPDSQTACLPIDVGVRLGELLVDVGTGLALQIVPSDQAVSLGLWTCHLARLAADLYGT